MTRGAKPDTVELVLPLARLRRRDASRAGGKAANLGELLAAGLPVPDGFCVTTAAYRLARGGTQVPESVAVAVRSAWAALAGAAPDLPLAVRSSATSEDTRHASAAGQYETVLNVRGPDDLLAAVRRCWDSLHSGRAAAYRARRGQGGHDPAMAVLVQPMLAPQCAGVVFTADPLSGDRRRVVLEAVRGTADALVSGRGTPERLVLTRVGEVLERTASGPVCLDDEWARRLVQLALRAERVFGVPQDIEWALADGQFWLLQSRPIAKPPRTRRSNAAAPVVWSNVNVGELLPDVVTPMAWSLLHMFVMQLFAPFFRLIGIDLRREPWFVRIAGRVYANLSIFARFGRALPGARLELDVAFGGHETTRPEVSAALRASAADCGWGVRARVLAGLPWLLLTFLRYCGPRSNERLVQKVTRRTDALVALELAGQSDRALLELLTTGIRDACRDANALAAAAVGVTLSQALFRLTRRWLEDDSGALANRLLSGAGAMASADSALELWRLAEWGRAQPEVRQVLDSQAEFGQAQPALQATPAGREFLARWGEWNTRHGHHTFAELDVGRPRWSESPDYVLGLLRSYAAAPADHTPPAVHARRDAERTRLVADCRLRLAGWRWRLLEYVMRRARRGLATRENFKSQAVRVVAVMRGALLEFGRRLVRRGVLAAPDDVFFFEVEELESLLDGRLGSAAGARVAARRAECERYRALDPPPVIVGTLDEAQSRTPAAQPVDGDSHVWRGLAVSPGRAAGPARVVLRPDGTDPVRPGEILVAPFTDPGWSVYFLTAAGLVVDMGGLLSHGSIVAREYGIPAVVNVGPATTRIRTGQWVEVDGDRGVVRVGGRAGTAGRHG